ncbi:MAG: HAMP domain-containing sensor histidine kinase, partial [Saprospiraceae bacterium]
TNYYIEPKDSIINTLTDFQESLLESDVFLKIATLETSSSLDMKDLYEFIFNSPPASYKNNITIELFDKKSGATLFNNHWADYYKLNQMYLHARKVGQNVYHNPLEDIYLIRLEIARSFPANASWYLFIIHESPADLPPPKTNGKFGYAVFSRNKLIEKYDGYESSPPPALLQSAMYNTITAGYSMVVTKPSDQYRLVSWKKVSGLIKPISLFSFIFTLSGVILLLLSMANTKLDFLPESLALKFDTRSSLKTKIQLAIILLILITFLIIGAITAFYFKNLIEANQTAKSQQETTSIVNNIRSDIQNIDDTEYALTYLVSKLKDLSFVHDKELSIYGQNGRLLGSTGRGNPYMHIPYTLWRHAVFGNHDGLTKNKDLVLENREYVPIYLTDDQPIAYVGIDHKSFNTSSGSILDFLSTILNAYIFLFLIAGAIAITIANSITQPLTILAEKLKKFKLGKTNEQLEWKSNDEIGTLIHDYNNLTHELERSAGLLAKTERDLAWREMAKQVAHEIKNPLTPMKLSIQYLDRTAKDHPDKAQELIPRISSTLIEQIDNLSQIANEFSNFASMPQATNEKIILNEIVETIHDLFRKRDDMDINMIEPIDDLYVFADKNHLVRILNNLLKNAIQAIPDNRRGKIEIELKRKESDAIIRISDNGTGIPDHMKDKVFTPNFTTKSSGTGLGLAISANMIESFNGRIYFETKVGEGTDFFVTIPLMRLDDYLTDSTRVILD